jgi:hypothetical protein
MRSHGLDLPDVHDFQYVVESPNLDRPAVDPTI